MLKQEKRIWCTYLCNPPHSSFKLNFIPGILKQSWTLSSEDPEVTKAETRDGCANFFLLATFVSKEYVPHV